MGKNILLIACGMIRDEMNLAMEKTGIIYDTVWMSADLHDNPDFLRIELQKEIDKHQDYEMILLSYGNCGKGLVGLASEKTKLAFFRSQDCIQILLHKNKELKNIRGETYFLTKGWMLGKKSLKEEYHHAIKKYGIKRAEKIMRIMFKNHQSLAMIDTGAYKLDDWTHCAIHLSKILNLEFMITQGDTELLEMLLSLNWDHQVAVIPPGNEISADDFGVECVVSGSSNIMK